MANSGMLQKVELIIVALLSIIFLVWAASKCNSSGKEELPITSEQEVVADTSQTEAAAAESEEEGTEAEKTKPSLIREKYTPLYVTIDGLKLRTEPNLESDVITLLGLFEEVEFMNEVTDSTLQISLGYEMADEPWVKVKHRKGQVGWVYGAGVSYYKKKREGVLE